MKTTKTLMTVASALLMAIGTQAGAAVITPAGATSTSSIGSPRTIDKTIDGSGLSDVSDPASVLDDSHAYDGTAYWLSASGAVGAGDEVLTFDLGGTYDIDTVHHWRYSRDGDRNLKTFDISFSTDGGANFSTPVSAASLGMADWSIGASDRSPSFVETRTFNTLSGVTDIQFSNLQNHGDTSFFALFEVRFGEAAPIPEPGSLALLGLGGLLIARRRRG